MMDWIMSEGGPLICLEKALVTSWGGIDRLTVVDPSATCDYDRACVTNDYLVMVPLAESMAMTLGAPPADSSFRYLPSGLLAIVQVLYAEPALNENEKLARLDESVFNAPLYLAEWQILSSPLILFDSAIPGGEFEDERLTFDIRPGLYRIRTQTFDPDPETSFLLHRFEPID